MLLIELWSLKVLSFLSLYVASLTVASEAGLSSLSLEGFGGMYSSYEDVD